MMRCEMSSVGLCATIYIISLSVMTLLLSSLPLTTSAEPRQVRPLPAILLSTRIFLNKSHSDYPGTRLSEKVQLLGKDKAKLSLQNINNDKSELPLSTVLVNKWMGKDGGILKLSKEELDGYSEGEERYKVKRNKNSSSHTPLHASHAFSHSLHINHSLTTPSVTSSTPSVTSPTASHPSLHTTPPTSVPQAPSSTLPPITTSTPSVEAKISNTSERREAKIKKLTIQATSSTMDHPYDDITNLSSLEDTREADLFRATRHPTPPLDARPVTHTATRPVTHPATLPIIHPATRPVTHPATLPITHPCHMTHHTPCHTTHTTTLPVTNPGTSSISQGWGLFRHRVPKFQYVERETHFFWSWEAALIVGLAGWWVVGLSSLAFLFRSSPGISLIQALCPSILSPDDDDEDMPKEYIIFLDGSPGMRRPSEQEIREREAMDYGLEDDDIWPKEGEKTKWIDTFSTLDHIEAHNQVLRNHQVLEIARVNRDHLWNERAVFPTTKASVIKKTDAFIPERETRENFMGTSTYWRTRRIDIPFPHPGQSSSSDSLSFILELEPPELPRLQRKLSLILEENIQA